MRRGIPDEGMRRIATLVQSQMTPDWAQEGPAFPDDSLYKALVSALSDATRYLFTSAVEEVLRTRGIDMSDVDAEDAVVVEVGEYIDDLVSYGARDLHNVLTSQAELDEAGFIRELRDELESQLDMMSHAMSEKYGVVLLNIEEVANEATDRVLVITEMDERDRSQEVY